MSTAIKNIPFHYFNKHNNCGSWCTNRLENDESLSVSCRTEYLKNPKLFEELQELFNDLAKNTHRFAACASSQANESFNAMVASKAPKSRSYSTSKSFDYRLACAVSQKNCGEKYMLSVMKKLQLSPGHYTKQHVKKVEHVKKKHSTLINKPEFKKRRLFLKKQRTLLRKKKETSEGNMYESNMGLLNSSEEDEVNRKFHGLKTIDTALPLKMVYFDLETSGLSAKADILQIAAICNDISFSVYLNPTQEISQRASEVTGLQNVEGNLLLNGRKVQSFPLSTAMKKFFLFLADLECRCILVVHNAIFDCPRLMLAIKNAGMMDHFQLVVQGFTDTLPIVKKITRKTEKGANSLEGLAKSLNITADSAHNALFDVCILQEIVQKLDISDDTLINCQKSWQTFLKEQISKETISAAAKKLLILRDCTTSQMRKK
ncbi:uncharacterized protein LOC122507311 [Leptopilina heterotoma]|uniref:uncharacterized protein LOC122507311 n=1 Tax=Leptopilina heterotoma TaxID=63436 RepID=UPI001CA98386|nr:uncharacterized protein LOC122507311 [Leptopilina heterotoma]